MYIYSINSFLTNQTQTSRNNLALKNILKAKSNQANTLKMMINEDAELVNKLNFFNANSEVTELTEGEKVNNSLYSLKLPFIPELKRQETAESLNLPYISLRNSSKYFYVINHSS